MVNLKIGNNILQRGSEEYNSAENELLGTEAYFSRKLQIEDQLLFLFASAHSNNELHPQFKEIEEQFQYFLDETEGKKRICVIEGSAKYAVEGESKKHAIEKYFEAGLLKRLAIHNEVEYFSPEPSKDQEVQILLEQYTAKQLYYFYVIRKYRSRHSLNEGKGHPQSFEDFINGIGMEKTRTRLGLDLKKPAFEIFAHIHEKKFGKTRGETSEELKFHATNPTIEGSFTNEISKNTFRDEFILAQLEAKLNEGYNLFIVYGSGHGIMRRKVLGY